MKSSLIFASAAAIVAGSMLVQARPFPNPYIQVNDLKATINSVTADGEAFFQRDANQLARRNELDLLVDASGRAASDVESEIQTLSHERTAEQGLTSEIVPASPDHLDGLAELRLPETHSSALTEPDPQAIVSKMREIHAAESRKFRNLNNQLREIEKQISQHKETIARKQKLLKKSGLKKSGLKKSISFSSYFPSLIKGESSHGGKLGEKKLKRYHSVRNNALIEDVEAELERLEKEDARLKIELAAQITKSNNAKKELEQAQAKFPKY